MPVADLGDISIHYQERGEGFPVLGIMGFALDQRFWAGQIPTITEHHRFITFDNRSIGRTSGPIAHTIDEMADDAYRLLRHLEIDRAIVLGLSMGGTIAQRLTLDHPEVVAAAMFGITWARPIEFMRRQHNVTRRFLETSELSQDDFVDASLIRMFTPRFFEIGRDTIDQLVRSFIAAGTEPDTDVLMAQLEALDKHDALGELGRIECPVLVVGGRMDQMAPGFASEEIAAAIPGARLEMFDTGHGLTVEEMERFNGLLRDWLAEVRAGL